MKRTLLGMSMPIAAFLMLFPQQSAAVRASAVHAGGAQPAILIGGFGAIHGFSCSSLAESYEGNYYDNHTNTPLFPGDIIVPGTSVGAVTPVTSTLSCTFVTAERPPIV